MKGKGRNVTILVQPDGALEARTLRFPLWVLRVGLAAAIALATLLVFIAVTYGPTVRAALRVPFLERHVERLEADNARIRELAAALDSLERRYNQVRGMLGGDLVPNLAKMGSNLPLAPTINAVSPGERTFPEGPTAPSFWPLDDPSYVTRGRSQDDPDGPHEGVDIAVAVGSVVRAAGGGTVSEAGSDPQFGLFVIVQHPGEYQSLYGHLSRIVVAKGQTVAPGEVIGLAGNTGRSSAPHLHLEVRFQGQTVDPLTLVNQEG
jgi:murein DD-endopeptidase MepM/ murein hydrolase activator NlpD